MNIRKVLFPGIIAILFSCSTDITPKGIIINGQFQNGAARKIYFSELIVNGINNLDSAILDETGLFRFRCNPSETGFYIVKSSSGEYIILLMEKNEEVNVFADMKQQPFTYQVDGSAGSVLLKEFHDRTLINLITADSLRSVLMENRESPDFYELSLSFDSLFQKLIDHQKLIEKTFIQQNPNSLASLIILNYKFGMTPVLNTAEDFPVFLELDSTLSIRYPGNKHVAFHHQRVVEFKRQEMAKQSIKKSKQ